MAQRRIDFLSLMYKNSSDPGNSPTASRRSGRPLRARGKANAIVREMLAFRAVGYAVRSPDSLLGLAIGLIRW